MEKKFSNAWISSKQPRKQRKYLANAPLHTKRKIISSNLSKELRKKYGKRATPLKKGDVVKIMRGKFKGKTGKVLSIKTKLQKIILEGIQIQKKDGSKVNFPLRHSNLQIIELNLEDKKRVEVLNRGLKKKEETPSQKKTLETKTSPVGIEKNKTKENK